MSMNWFWSACRQASARDRIEGYIPLAKRLRVEEDRPYVRRSGRWTNTRNNRSGPVGAAWFHEINPESLVDCPSQISATLKCIGMGAGETIYLRTPNKDRAQDIRKGLEKLKTFKAHETLRWAFSASRYVVRVQCMPKTAPNPCDVGQGEGFGQIASG